jgi:phosphoglycerol transferase MdoB-like AlkP superfamily enzyme
MPLNNQLSNNRVIYKNIPKFKNFVIIVYESVRWKYLNLDDKNKPTVTPFLKRLASEGLLAKCYVSLPHSSKAYFSILTGRHPYPDIEMREATQDYHESIFHILKNKQPNFNILSFSSLFYGFENMGGELDAIGIKNRFQTDKMMELIGKKVDYNSSFGMADDFLYSAGINIIAKEKKAFSAIFFPTAAHYPYECRGSKIGRHNYEDYQACLTYSDNLLEQMVNDFEHYNLLNDTLFVIVGDHGESFGEHGQYVHNSSMYEEEITVPLIFWSSNKNLKMDSILTARQIDIAPTIADFMGILDSKISIQGSSLLRRKTSVTPIAFSTTFFGDLGQALIEFPNKYIYEPSYNKLFYFDLKNDPNEKKPLEVNGKEKNKVINRFNAFNLYQKNIFENK